MLDAYRGDLTGVARCLTAAEYVEPGGLYLSTLYPAPVYRFAWEVAGSWPGGRLGPSARGATGHPPRTFPAYSVRPPIGLRNMEGPVERENGCDARSHAAPSPGQGDIEVHDLTQLPPGAYVN